eukprot:1148598-Pelagomonas_calceolata.AAC.1
MACSSAHDQPQGVSGHEAYTRAMRKRLCKISVEAPARDAYQCERDSRRLPAALMLQDYLVLEHKQSQKINMRAQTHTHLLAHAVVWPMAKDQEIGGILDVLLALGAKAVRVEGIRVLISLCSGGGYEGVWGRGGATNCGGVTSKHGGNHRRQSMHPDCCAPGSLAREEERR